MFYSNKLNYCCSTKLLKKIRSAWNEEQQWYFSIIDEVETLTDSNDPKQYIKRIRKRDEPLILNRDRICTPVEMIALDGKNREIQAANIKGLVISL